MPLAARITTLLLQQKIFPDRSLYIIFFIELLDSFGISLITSQFSLIFKSFASAFGK